MMSIKFVNKFVSIIKLFGNNYPFSLKGAPLNESMHDDSSHCSAVAPVAMIETRRRDERGRIFWSVALASLLVTFSYIIGYSSTSRAGHA